MTERPAAGPESQSERGDASQPLAADPDRDRSKALFTVHRWLIRRVESVSLRDATSATRALTVDFIIPTGVGHEGAPTHLPLVLLRKVPPVLNIDLYDEDRRSLPVLSRRENARLSANALKELIAYVLDEPAARYEDICGRLAEKDPAQAADALDDLVKRVRALEEPTLPRDRYRHDTRVRRLLLVARAAVGNSIIWVPIDGTPGDRKIVKFAYEEQIEILSSLALRACVFLGFRSLLVAFATPHLRGCQSYHFEASVPHDLELHEGRLNADIRENADPDTRRELDLFKWFRRDLHLYADLVDTHTLQSTSITFKVRAGRRGMLSLAMSAALIIAGMLWLLFALRRDLDPAAASQAVPPMLVLIPAVLVVIVIRPDEHPFSAFLYTGTRYLILFTGIVAAASGAALAFASDPGASSTLEVYWLVSALLATLVAILLLVGWIASRPRRERGVAWAFVTTVAAIALAGWATAADTWDVVTIASTGALVVAAVRCLAIGLEGRIVPPPRELYFDADLRAGGILPKSTSDQGDERGTT